MKKVLILVLGMLLIGVNVFAQGDLKVNGSVGIGVDTESPIEKLDVRGMINMDGGGGGAIKLGNVNPESFTIENQSGAVNFKMMNFQGAHPIVFQMKADQGIGGHFSIVPGGRFSYWLFEESPLGLSPDFRVCGQPSGASSNQCVIFEIVGTNNDLNMSTDGTNSDILLMPQANVGIGTTSPANPLEMASGAHVTSGGVWTNASSRDYKQNISKLTGDDAIKTLKGLDPVTFNYKAEEEEKYVGFIAEDVPELVAMKDRKGLSPMDIVAVLTKVAQEQQKTIAKLTEEVNQLKKDIKFKDILASSDMK